MTSETETETKETRTARFAQWLMDRESKRQDKESNIEGMIRFNLFLSACTLAAVAGTTVTNYLMMAYAWL
jgi:hypothetical protein